MARVRSVLARLGLRPEPEGDPDERESPYLDPAGAPAPAVDPTGVPAPAVDPTGVPAPAADPTRPAEAPEAGEGDGDEVDDWGLDSFPASDPPPGP
jgi:hypothetical protein